MAVIQGYEGSKLLVTGKQLTYSGNPFIILQSPCYNEQYSSALPAKVIVKYMEQNPDITNPHYNEHIFPVPWHFVISGFHCII